MKLKKLICLGLIYTFWLSLPAPLVRAQNQVSTAPQQDTSQPEQKGLQFRLREDVTQTEDREISPPAAIADLSEAETNAILRRLPSLPAETSETSDFKLRANSLPPPRTGKIISTKFPDDDSQSAPNINDISSGELEVIRFAPQGLIPLAAELSVTFSQPMIAITSQEQASESVPVNLTPSVKGKWRWVGTKTLIFDPGERFPMGTDFVAKIPAGIKSAAGGMLAKEVSWTFSTPPPKVENFLPAITESVKNIRRDAVFFASFNQDIDAEAVLAKIGVFVRGKQTALRFATQTEIESDKSISQVVKQSLPKRWLAFRAIELLPPDSPVKITFETGIPSAEGNLTSVKPETFSLSTFDELKFSKSYCGYGETGKRCLPGNAFEIEFNNLLDAESFDKSQIKIKPNIENTEISIYENKIIISGYAKKARTTYKVTVSGSLKDEFGQVLEKDISTTFKLGAEASFLSSQGGDLVVLDPNAKFVFPVYSTDYKTLKVRLYGVKAEDYLTFQSLKKGNTENFATFGKLISDESIKIEYEPDTYTETRIDISPALADGFGHALLIVEPPVVNPDNEDQRIIVWLEATQIGLDAFADYENLTVFANDLKNGKPLRDVQVSLSSSSNSITDDSGLANLRLPEATESEKKLLIARRGADSAILFNDSYSSPELMWAHKYPSDNLRWFIFNDRNMYRTGETVSFKGYIRKITGGKFTDIEQLPGAADDLDYVLKDPLNNEILRGDAKINAFGAFDFQIKLPDNLNLGYQRLELSVKSDLEDRTFTHSFQVEEFRRPEFEVSTKLKTPVPVYLGDSATVSVEAKYYSGGFLSNAETNWKVTAKPANYTPPNREDYTFGTFIQWWGDYYSSDYDETTSQQFKGVTDSKGKHHIAIDSISADKAHPFTINAEARVQDVNRQTFASSTTLLIHPSELYVGLRTPKTFVSVNEQFKIETITTDIDGNAVANAFVSIVAELKDWQQVKGEWQEVTIDTQACQIKSGSDKVSCNFTPKKPGFFTVKASVFDRRGRRNESELTVWVAGANIEPSRSVEQETVELIPGKKEYMPNDVAEILVNAPFYPAEGVVSIRREGIVKIERFTMNEASTILHIPIEENYLPNIHVQVDLVGATKRIVFDDERDSNLPKRPAYAAGELNLNISTASRNLTVKAEPAVKTLLPGGAAAINIDVKDKDGNAVAGSEIAVVAVDESILALTNYSIANPLDYFYKQIPAGVRDYHSRESVLLINPDGIGNVSGNGNGNGDGDDYSSAISKPAYPQMIDLQNESVDKIAKSSEDEIRLRTNFNALAIFAPSVKTGANGKATVNLTLPDNLTRYRITAVAVTSSKQFGKGESSITAKQPLVVRPSAPRFLNFGDRAELPVVLQNQTDNSLMVDVAIRAANAALTNGNGRKVMIPANDRVEVRFPITADKAGYARFQTGATSGKFADAAEIDLPVYIPATTESFAAYGTTGESETIVQPVVVPKDIFPQFGGIEVTTSSTQLQQLTDAFIYLQNYSFECSEQVSSRILSVAALRDVLQAFDAKDLPSKGQIETKMKFDIRRLEKLQHSDGGFSFWRSDDESLPFVSVHAAHALVLAGQKGYAVPEAMSRKAISYLKNIEAKYPGSYDSESRRVISAYALYVRNLLGDRDAGKARKLLREAALEDLSPEAIGWILSVLADDKDSTAEVDLIKRHLLNRTVETAGAAHFVTKYKDGEYVLLSSERRADGIILEALLKAEPNSDLIPKIVRGLLAGKTKGRWANTQENVFILLALNKYFQTYEKVTPNFITRIWLGQSFAGEQQFTERSSDSNLINVPMQYLTQQNATPNLILDKQGEGRLYYRIAMKYAPQDLKLLPADYGFAITRTYEAVDRADDVKQNADGSWTIKLGARVRVRVQMVAPTRRYHVALVDKLPAGFEIINQALAVSETLPDDTRSKNLRPDGYSYYGLTWYDHQNLRDERAEAFTLMLGAGIWSYSYAARATTPGDFVAPPAKAEEMYAPETYGRTGPDYIKIE